MTGCEYGIDFITLISGRKLKGELLRLLLNSGCHLIDVVYVKGSVNNEYFKDMLGLVPEEKKVMITGLITHNLTSQLLSDITTKFNFDKPNTGIAFVVPVDKLSV